MSQKRRNSYHTIELYDKRGSVISCSVTTMFFSKYRKIIGNQKKIIVQYSTVKNKIIVHYSTVINRL